MIVYVIVLTQSHIAILIDIVHVHPRVADMVAGSSEAAVYSTY